MEVEPSRSVAPAARGHMPMLDGLRGLAIALVVVHNAASLQTTAETTFLKAVLALHDVGWIGVQLFFVLSGFLITGILLDTKGAKHFYGAFYGRRALRIFPLYYGLLFGWLVLLPLLAPRAATLISGQAHQVWYWTYLSNWVQPFGKDVAGLTHFWSLAVEEQFYLVWPLCVALLRPRALGRLTVVMIVAALSLRIGLRVSHAPVLTSYMFTFARMDALALGALLALVVRNERALARVRPWLASTGIGSTVVLLGIAVATRGFHSDTALVQTLGYTLLAVLSGVLVLLAATIDTQQGGRFVALFDAPSLRMLGKYSYGLYVFHLPIMALLRHRAEWTVNHASTLHRMMALVTFVGLVSVLSMGAAMASYELVERHCLALKRYLVARPRPRSYGAPSHSGSG